MSRAEHALPPRDTLVFDAPGRPAQTYLLDASTTALPWPELKAKFEELEQLRLALWVAVLDVKPLRSVALDRLVAEGERHHAKDGGVNPPVLDVPIRQIRSEKLAQMISTQWGSGRLVVQFAGEVLRWPQEHDLFPEKSSRYVPSDKALSLIRNRLKAVIKLRNDLISRNMLLVAKWAKKFSWGSLSFEDLMNEGAIGLSRAIDLFEVERGFRFSTYATNWIRHQLHRAHSDTGSMIRIPVHLKDLLPKVKNLRGEGLSAEEMAEHLGEDIKRVRAALGALRLEPLSTELALRDDVKLGDVLPSDEPPLDDALADAVLVHEVLEKVALLPARLQTVLHLRFGLGDSQPQKLHEVGEILGVSRERVRQLETQALELLRKKECASSGVVDARSFWAHLFRYKPARAGLIRHLGDNLPPEAWALRNINGDAYLQLANWASRLDGSLQLAIEAARMELARDGIGARGNTRLNEHITGIRWRLRSIGEPLPTAHVVEIPPHEPAPKKKAVHRKRRAPSRRKPKAARKKTARNKPSPKPRAAPARPPLSPHDARVAAWIELLGFWRLRRPIVDSVQPTIPGELQGLIVRAPSRNRDGPLAEALLAADDGDLFLRQCGSFLDAYERGEPVFPGTKPFRPGEKLWEWYRRNVEAALCVLQEADPSFGLSPRADEGAGLHRGL